MNLPHLFIMECGKQFFTFPPDPDTRGRTPIRNKPQRWMGPALHHGSSIIWEKTHYNLVWVDRDFKVIYGVSHL